MFSPSCISLSLCMQKGWGSTSVTDTDGKAIISFECPHTRVFFISLTHSSSFCTRVRLYVLTRAGRIGRWSYVYAWHRGMALFA